MGITHVAAWPDTMPFNESSPQQSASTLVCHLPAVSEMHKRGLFAGSQYTQKADSEMSSNKMSRRVTVQDSRLLHHTFQRLTYIVHIPVHHLHSDVKQENGKQVLQTVFTAILWKLHYIIQTLPFNKEYCKSFFFHSHKSSWFFSSRLFVVGKVCRLSISEYSIIIYM